MKLGLLLLPALASTLRVDMRAVHRAASSAVITAACGAALCFNTGPASAATGLSTAIIDSATATHPILKALPKDTFPPFAEKVGGLILDIKPEKLGKSIDLGLDLALSVPPEKLATFNSELKDAFGGLKTDSCDLVPLPPPSLTDRFVASEALAKVDAAKVKAFGEKWGESLRLLPKTPTAICLPSVEALGKLSMAQAELGRSFGAEEAKKFGVWNEAMLKSSITPNKVLPLLGEAQKQTMAAPLKERQAFKSAGKKLEEASKLCVALGKKYCEL